MDHWTRTLYSSVEQEEMKCPATFNLDLQLTVNLKVAGFSDFNYDWPSS